VEQHKQIVHVIVGLGTGGAEKVLYKILDCGLETRNRSAVISLSDKGPLGPRIESMGVPVYEMKFGNTLTDVFRFFRFVSLVRTIEPGLLVGWMYHSNIVVLLARFFLKRKVGVIWNIRHALHEMNTERWRTRFFIRVGALLSRAPDKVIFNSHTSLRHHEHIGYTLNNIEVIPNGFNMECRQRTDINKYILPEELGLDEDISLVGIIGRFHIVKGYRYFIEASKRIIEEYPGVEFALVGRQVDTSNQSLKQWIAGSTYEGRYHLLGERVDIERILPSLKVLVSASITESFPNVLGEAMACGVPCVATDVGDTAAVLAGSGIIVEAKNSHELYRGISQVLSWDEHKYNKISRRARERIETHYSNSTMIERHEQKYDEVLGAR